MSEMKEPNRKTVSEEVSECKFKIRAGVFLATVSGFAAIAGFSRTIITARKEDQKLYEQATKETVNLIESGTKLATRALMWGTLYAFLGTGTLVFGIWKLSGATANAQDFRFKMGSILPKLSKDSQVGRTEFDGLNDIMEYVATTSNRKA